MTMDPIIRWGGTGQESLDLVAAITADGRCTCKLNAAGQRESVCGGHAMILDQRSVDHLLYGRRLRPLIVAEEWMGQEATDPLELPAEAQSANAQPATPSAPPDVPYDLLGDV